MKRSEKPVFGILNGLKVLMAGQSAAGPFAARMMADHGADVIWIESSKGLDVARNGSGMAAEIERRNMRNISMNTSSDEGKEIFKKLIAEVDIFIENAKPGQYKKWGLDDDVLWSINPKLVIAHVSGYGQYGDPAFEGRAAYDPTMQSFSGLVYANTHPGEDYYRVAPIFVSDYYAGYAAAFSCLAAYINAQKTGKGESLDCAQYEAVINSGWGILPDVWNGVKEYEFKAFPYSTIYGGYACKDGKSVFVVSGGSGVMKALLGIIGLGDQYGSEKFPEGFNKMYKTDPGSDDFLAAWLAYAASKTAVEVEAELAAAGVPCSLVINHMDMLSNPQYTARESVTKWNKVSGEEMIGANVVPKAKNNPGQIFRGAPKKGQDTADILADLGYSPDEIAKLAESQVIVKAD
jgi:L-carnitine CoA-transferase